MLPGIHPGFTRVPGQCLKPRIKRNDVCVLQHRSWPPALNRTEFQAKGTARTGAQSLDSFKFSENGGPGAWAEARRS